MKGLVYRRKSDFLSDNSATFVALIQKRERAFEPRLFRAE